MTRIYALAALAAALFAAGCGQNEKTEEEIAALRKEVEELRADVKKLSHRVAQLRQTPKDSERTAEIKQRRVEQFRPENAKQPGATMPGATSPSSDGSGLGPDERFRRMAHATPEELKKMTPEQRRAYHEERRRLHEERRAMRRGERPPRRRAEDKIPENAESAENAQ